MNRTNHRSEVKQRELGDTSGSPERKSDELVAGSTTQISPATNDRTHQEILEEKRKELHAAIFAMGTQIKIVLGLLYDLYFPYVVGLLMLLVVDIIFNFDFISPFVIGFVPLLLFPYLYNEEDQKIKIV